MFLQAQNCAYGIEDLEMVYEEYCEGLLLIAAYKIPSAYYSLSVKADLFIKHYLLFATYQQNASN